MSVRSGEYAHGQLQLFLFLLARRADYMLAGESSKSLLVEQEKSETLRHETLLTKFD